MSDVQFILLRYTDSVGVTSLVARLTLSVNYVYKLLRTTTIVVKFNEGSLSVYLQNWNITTNAHVHNYNTREYACIHKFKVKHEFATKCLKYNLPKLINDTPERVKDKINTHSLQGFINYGKNDMIHKYGNICIIQHCYTCLQSQLHQ